MIEEKRTVRNEMKQKKKKKKEKGHGAKISSRKKNTLWRPKTRWLFKMRLGGILELAVTLATETNFI
jgi:hypothetical protein